MTKANTALQTFIDKATAYAKVQNATTVSEYNTALKAAQDAYNDLFLLFDAGDRDKITFSDGTTQTGGVKNIVDAVNMLGQTVPKLSGDDYHGYLTDSSGKQVLDENGAPIKLESCMRTLRTAIEDQLKYLNRIQPVSL